MTLFYLILFRFSISFTLNILWKRKRAQYFLAKFLSSKCLWLVELLVSEVDDDNY